MTNAIEQRMTLAGKIEFAFALFFDIMFRNPARSQNKVNMPSNNNSHQREKTHDLDIVGQWAARRKILILDDDVAFSEMTRMLLEQNGFEVDLASDGVQGIKKIMVSDYSAILCDMVMPNLAGDMFYIAVERVKPHLCKRIIFITGHKGDRKTEDFVRKVKGLILWKPFKNHILIETIQAVEKKTSGTAV